MSFKDVKIPKRMRALEQDSRGYPIPFIVLRDSDDKPHFTINDSDRQRQALVEKRCPICGSDLDPLLWFVGGPLSAFHQFGLYLDTAMHYECMDYALRVCPYLSMPNYLGRIDLGTLDPTKLPEGSTMFVDETMLPERPSLFVAVAARGQSIIDRAGVMSGIRPARPYELVEFWRDGKRLAPEMGFNLVVKALKDFEQANKEA